MNMTGISDFATRQSRNQEDMNPTAISPFFPINEAQLRRQRALFVEPERFPKKPESSRDRIFIIIGERGSGRQMAATNFASRIADV
ncbi:MAG: hypothetical protein K8L99_33380, partial [Anaerolineae bacterium]|nr:hypothetical protein [Anaerolineae bacterium]